MIPVTDDGEHDERFQMAVSAARRLTSQCLAHMERVSSKMGERYAAAAPSSPYGIDLASAAQDEHWFAFKQLAEHVDVTTNALVSHLSALKLLLDGATFHPLSAMAITRSIAEVAASGAWMIRPGLSADERAARGYAAMFSAIDHGLSNVEADEAARIGKLRDQLIQEVEQADVRVLWAVKDGVTQDEVAQVQIGRSRACARAKVRFKYLHRVRDEIPRVSPLYSAMSGAVHGNRMSITASWNTPDAYARMIGHVTTASTEAWSRAVHDWVGVTAGPFLNEDDRQNILRSIPLSTYAGLQAKLAALKSDARGV